MSAVRLVKATGKCPHCEVRKHQIDTTEERALQIVSDAVEKHVREAHGGRLDVCDHDACDGIAGWTEDDNPAESAVECRCACHTRATS